LRGCETNHFGFGILKSTIKKISKQTEIAALIILLINLRRLECQSNIHNTALPNLFEK
jgi:hypothetical protein